MKETMIEPRVLGSVKDSSAAKSVALRKPATTGELTAETGEGILAHVEARLAQLQQGTVEAAAGLIAERVDGLIELKVKKALTGSLLASTDRMKDAVLKVMQGVLLESGLLEKFIARAVEAKVHAIAGGNAGQGAKKEDIEKSVKEIVAKEISRALAGEEMKMLLDDKFRAMTLYLKTDVLPKAVAQALKAPAKA